MSRVGHGVLVLLFVSSLLASSVAVAMHSPVVLDTPAPAQKPTGAVANPGPNQTVDQNTLVSFNGSASTGSGGIVNYTWTVNDHPGVPGAVLSLPPGGLLYQFDPVRPFLYELGNGLGGNLTVNWVDFVNLSSGNVEKTFILAHTPVWPMSMSVAPNGTYLVVGIPTGDRGYYDFGPYQGYLAAFDLVNRTEIGEFSVANDIYRVAAVDSGYAIVAGGSGQWAPLQIVNVHNGTVPSSPYVIWQYSDIVVHPHETRIYTIDQDGIYPPSVHRYDFTPQGGFSSWLTWPYFGTYPGSDIWLSSGGDLLLTGNGYLLHLSDNASQDMPLLSTLPANPFDAATFDPAGGLIDAVNYGHLYFYDNQSYAPLGDRDLGFYTEAMAVRGNQVQIVSGGELYRVQEPRTRLYGVAPRYEFANAGIFNVTLTVQDAYGDVASATMTVTVRDTTPPVAIAGAPQNASLDSWAALDGSGSTDNVGVVNYTWTFVDVSPQVLYGVQPTYYFGNLGTFDVVLTVRDAAGNSASATTTVTVVDRIPPTTAAVLQGTLGLAGWYRSNVTVALVANDIGTGVATTFFEVDGGPWQAYAGPFVFALQGVHYLDYYSVDEAGNAGNVSNVTLLIDATLPSTQAIVTHAPGNNGWSQFFAGVRVRADDIGSGVAVVYIRVDNGTWQSFKGPFGSSLIGPVPIGSGIHIVQFYAVDVAGNTGPVTSITVKVDIDDPFFTSAGPSGIVTNSAVELEWSARDNTSGVADYRVSVDAGPFTEVGNVPRWTVNLTDGVHTVAVQAVDAAGRVTLATFSFRVDTNLFSPTGPYGIVPLVLVAIGVGVGVPFGYVILSRRRPR